MLKISRSFFFFCVFGLIASVIDLAAFNVYLYLSDIFILSRVGGILTSFLFTFYFNKKITFRSSSKKVKRQMILFVVLYTISMVLNTLVGVGIINIAGEENRIIANIAAISGTVVSMVLNYLGSRFLVFKE